MTQPYHPREGTGWALASTSAPWEKPWREELAGLLRIQSELLRKVARLQKAERDLFQRVQSSRRRGGRTAIVQIEREPARVAWVEFTPVRFGAHAGSHAQARAPPSIS